MQSDFVILCFKKKQIFQFFRDKNIVRERKQGMHNINYTILPIFEMVAKLKMAIK